MELLSLLQSVGMATSSADSAYLMQMMVLDLLQEVFTESNTNVQRDAVAAFSDNRGVTLLVTILGNISPTVPSLPPEERLPMQEFILRIIEFLARFLRNRENDLRGFVSDIGLPLLFEPL